MKTFKVTFVDEIQADNEEDAYENLLIYLQDVVKFEDVTAFEFTEVKQEEKVS